MAYHHRTATIALTLALALGVLALPPLSCPTSRVVPQAQAHARRSARAAGTPGSATSRGRGHLSRLN
jgi:hypothetical protein